MLLAPCSRLDESGTIWGKDCDGGFVVFGPYASIAGEADVRVRFDVESSEELTLSSDIVSKMGESRHGHLDARTVRPDVKRSLSYRARLSKGGEAVEARIFVQGKDDVDFKISNLELSIY